jgi:hypothetical protein
LNMILMKSEMETSNDLVRTKAKFVWQLVR